MKIIKKCKVFAMASIVLVACEKKDQVLLPSPNTGLIKAKTQAQVNLDMPGDTPKREAPYSPRFSVTAGKYSADIEVKLYSKLDDNATIFYTMDGSTPTVNSLEYVKPIKIIGNGTAVQVRAIALYDSEYWMWPSGEVEKGESGIEDWSKVSASYYVIDYSHDPEDYDNSLSLNQVKSNMLGTWIGHVTTPWVEPYNVEFKFYSNGTYSSHAISSSNHINTGGEHWWPTLYYGTDDNSNIKTMDVYDIDADGKATAEIVVLFQQGTTNVDKLKHIAFSKDLNYLEFDLWHRNEYGPVSYKLTRMPQ